MAGRASKLITFNRPIAMQVQSDTGSHRQSLELVQAVRGTWTTDDAGSDGKITVTDVVLSGQSRFTRLVVPVVLETITSSTNIVAIQ